MHTGLVVGVKIRHEKSFLNPFLVSSPPLHRAGRNDSEAKNVSFQI